MPVHSCSFNAVEETVAAIEASGERIVSVVSPTDSTCVIFTYVANPRGKSQGVERR